MAVVAGKPHNGAVHARARVHADGPQVRGTRSIYLTHEAHRQARCTPKSRTTEPLGLPSYYVYIINPYSTHRQARRHPQITDPTLAGGAQAHVRVKRLPHLVHHAAGPGGRGLLHGVLRAQDQH